MMKKRIILLVLAISLTISLYGCKNIPFLNKKEEKEIEVVEEVDPNFPVEVAGVSIENKPERVVVLSASMLERICDLELQEFVVGVPEYTNYPAEMTEIANCGTALIPDIEKIEELKTDLLITYMPLSEKHAQRLQDNGVIILQLENPVNFDELMSSYNDLALALGGGVDGRQIGQDFTDNLSEWFSQLKAATTSQEPVSVLYIRRLDFTLATGDTLEGDLLNQLGFENLAYNYTNWTYPKAEAELEEEKEKFQKVNAYFLGSPDVTIEMLEENEFYKKLPATTDKKYLEISYDVFDKQGLRMFEQIRLMAVYAYPEGSIPEWTFPSNLEVPITEENIPD